MTTSNRNTTTASTFSSRAKALMDGILHHKRIANTYLFCGPYGSFTPSGAWYFVMSLHCNAQSVPCQQCVPCRQLLNQTYPDHISVNTETTIKVEDIRQLQEQIKYGPSANPYLTVTVHQANTLTQEAANAFLKSLEEPPDGLVFILISTSEDAVLPTIRSRSQIIHFPPDAKKGHEAIFDQYELDTGNPFPFKDLRINDILGKNPVERLEIAQSLSQDKRHVKLVLDSWLSELGQHKDNRDRYQRHAELLIASIEKLHFNVNVRLLLESLLIKL